MYIETDYKSKNDSKNVIITGCMGGHSSVYKMILSLRDDKGRKFIVSKGEGMKDIQGLGVVDTDRIVGAAPGSSISLAGKEFMVTEASLTDVLACIKRGPQWITLKDAAQIVANCDIGPGKRVLEIGTGTGALTIVLAHAVGTAGKIISYEINYKNANLAMKNVELAGYSEVIEIRNSDGASCREAGTFDAATIDMPEPWTLLEVVTDALKPGGYLCAYLPTMNQVEKAINGMRAAGYAETHVLENIQREIVVGSGGTRPSYEMLGHTGYLCFGRKL